MKYKYRVESELGVKHFKTYKNLVKWIAPYWPTWLHKLKVYKVVNGYYHVGQFIEDNRWPIKF